MDADALHKLTASDAARLIAAGTTTSEALASACLARIAARDGEVRAFAHLDPELALSRARAADERQRSGLGLGPLHGVPIAIKDIIDTADYPTECGSAAFAGRRPERDAACVAALRAAGAVVVGKTTTTELATRTPTVTRNPHNLEHTPGGSSAGSAAAVADGMVPAALGTQTAGSVIRPASFCGTFGFKPSFGLIARTGVLTQSPSLDTIGIFARSIPDLALITEVVQAYDSGDPMSAGRHRPALLATATMDWPLTPRFAVVKGSAWSAAAPVMREAFGELVEALGTDVIEIDIDPLIEQGLLAARTLQQVELAHHYGPILDDKPGLVSEPLAATIRAGRETPGYAYVRALEARTDHAAVLGSVFSDHGAILTPAAPGPAPRGLSSTGDPAFNLFWTYLGLPAVTVPLLECDGMPVGVQIVGAFGDDARLLRTARLLAERLARQS